MFYCPQCGEDTEETALCVNWNKENVFRTKEESEVEIERLNKME